MIIEVDLRRVPPALTLLEPDDFGSFLLRARGGHAFVGRDTLLSLAGDERATNADWVSRLDAMLAYASSKGWADAEGATRAHVEYVIDEQEN